FANSRHYTINSGIVKKLFSFSPFSSAGQGFFRGNPLLFGRVSAFLAGFLRGLPVFWLTFSGNCFNMVS
ncbi:MAG: hypothetical protein RR295_07760, partial [Oscillospiraceae bacterium]